jgi:carboxyl-terminal processing protease
MKNFRVKTGFKTACVLSASLWLAACGGGGDGGSGAASGSTACDVASQKDWLRSYMLDWYYWTGRSPNPDPAAFDTVQKYFDALLYSGDPVVPKDRWSYIQDSASYNQFFGAGKTLGYGVFVNGLELKLPLKLRYTEPQSPAAAAGLKRGDSITSVNGRSAAELIAANDFGLLTPAKAGDMLTLEIVGDAGARTVQLSAATYDLTPVSAAKVLDVPGRGKAGYVLLKDFVTQAEAPLATAFAQFRAQGASELILDLRYNGGGRISTANVLASLVAGASVDGKVFAQLSNNAKHSAADNTVRMGGGPASAFKRVVVLTGQRTCSASELIVNGLKPYVEVVTIGDTSCGKPFGFNPVESCGSVFSAVNFESTNGLGQGRYYSGIGATCPALDDFSGALGDPSESLTSAATRYLQTGVCPLPPVALRAQPLRSPTRAGAADPGERPGRRVD